MSEGLNRFTGIGQLGADPELRVTTAGQAVLKLRIACTESYMDRNNSRQERTEWVKATMWGPRAEALAKILAKGDKIYIEGSLHTSSYEKNGQKVYSTEINVREVVLCGGGRRGGDAPRGAGSVGTGPEPQPPPLDTDDIPF